MKILLFSIFLALAVSIQQLKAGDVTIVDWDGTGAYGQQVLNYESARNVTTSGIHTFAYDESLSWNPQEESAGNFSVAISSSVGASPAVPHVMRLDASNGKGLIQLLLRGSLASPPKMRGLLFFTKSHFSHGTDELGKKIRFSPGSRLYFSGMLDGLSPEARWLVRDGETWYISESTLEPQVSYNKSEPRELLDPASARWAEYHPQGAPLEVAPTVYDTHVFDDITAVGVFWDSYESPSEVGGTSFSRIAISAFLVQADE